MRGLVWHRCSLTISGLVRHVVVGMWAGILGDACTDVGMLVVHMGDRCTVVQIGMDCIVRMVGAEMAGMAVQETGAGGETCGVSCCWHWGAVELVLIPGLELVLLAKLMEVAWELVSLHVVVVPVPCALSW